MEPLLAMVPAFVSHHLLHQQSAEWMFQMSEKYPHLPRKQSILVPLASTPWFSRNSPLSAYLRWFPR